VEACRVEASTKGETLLDTVDNLSAMYADMFVVRHSSSGAAHLIAKSRRPPRARDQCRRRPPCAPDSRAARHLHHRHYKKDFTGLSVAIVGDVLHSRVARSLIHALTTLGAPDVRVIGPRTLAAYGGGNSSASPCITTCARASQVATS